LLIRLTSPYEFRVPAKIAVVIPARFASTRFPGKPLFALAGKPMIQHVWERCALATGIERVIVATEDERIADACKAFGADCMLTSEGCRSGTDRVAEVARDQLDGYTHVINVQGDEPLVDPDTITQLAKSLADDPGIEMITSASVFEADDDVQNPNAVKVVMDRLGNALYFSRSPLPYVRNETPGLRLFRHQGIYGYTMELLFRFVNWKPTLLENAESLEQLRALENGVKIRVVEVKHLSVGVDTLADAEAITELLETLLASKSNPARGTKK
jgi:3-deoxy-manno-octulosonate cytidylyltransferase (CMP-KDO synthetase)